MFRKTVSILAVFVTLCAVSVGNAAACSDTGWLSAMNGVNKMAMKGSNAASNDDYLTAAGYARIAKRMHNAAPLPCKSQYKLARYQYGIAWDYEYRAFNEMATGSTTTAVSYMKQAVGWMKRGTASLRAGN